MAYTGRAGLFPNLGQEVGDYVSHMDATYCVPWDRWWPPIKRGSAVAALGATDAEGVEEWGQGSER